MQVRTLATASAAIAYVAATQWLMTAAPASPWNAVIVIGPMLACVAAWAWQKAQRSWAGLAAAALLALVLQAGLGGGLAVEALYVAQHVAIQAALAVVFGLTLGAGREPLITALARRVHAALTPDMVAYCRRLTGAWTVYFVVMALASLLVFALAPFSAWAAFANLVTPVALALFLVVEYWLRYRWHPEFERAGLRSAMRAWSASQGRGGIQDRAP